MRTRCIAGVLFVAWACGPAQDVEERPRSEERELVVYATAYPVAWMAERLTEGLGRVVCPVPEGEDPIHWEPPRDVLEGYRSASLVVANGAGFARWLTNASLPESRIVRSADGFAHEFLHYESRTHSHGSGGEHTHAGIDPHTWLDPVNARRQAGAIAEALIARRAQEHARIEANLARLEAELEALEAEWRGLDEGVRAVALLASHPAYDYLLRRMGWEATNLDLDPEAELTPDARASVEAALVVGRRNVMLWESEPLASVRATLTEELGVTSVVVPPVEVLGAAQRSAGEDYLSLQLAAIARLRAALE